MEQSTMLEPSNNLGGPQFESEEEMREISSQLGRVKKKHDVARKQVVHMEEELSRVKKEIE
jgi:archaellum component FlaC